MKITPLLLAVMAIMISSCAAPIESQPQVVGTAAVSAPALPTPTSQAQISIASTQSAVEQPTLVPTSEHEVCRNPYYPVVDGATWFYSMPKGDNAIHTIHVVGDNTFTLTVEAKDATYTIDGTCTDEGISLMNVPGVSSTYSDSDGSSALTTQEIEGVTLPNDVQVGDDWSQFISVSGSSGGQVTLSATIDVQSSAVGFEVVTVPEGTYYALKVEQDTELTMAGSTMKSHQVDWYAQGVGVIKSVVDQVATVELTMADIP